MNEYTITDRIYNYDYDRYYEEREDEDEREERLAELEDMIYEDNLDRELLGEV